MKRCKNCIYLALAAAFFSAGVQAHSEDDPLLTTVILDRVEVGLADSDHPLSLSLDAWAGYDLQKVWFKAEYESTAGVTEHLELQALYSRALTTYWDFQLGVRHDAAPQPTRQWAVLALQGLTPYFLEMDTSLFISESGQLGARLEAEYELKLTQQWVLAPEVEFNFHSKDDPDFHTGSGLSDMGAALRLRYEIRPELAPYIGLTWDRKFGRTADLIRVHGDGHADNLEETRVVLGLHAWF